MPPKRPRDPFQLAKQVGDIATGQAAPEDPDEGKNQDAVSLGRKGGQKGGRVTASRLTAEQRKAAAKKAATARWRKSRTDNA